MMKKDNEAENVVETETETMERWTGREREIINEIK